MCFVNSNYYFFWIIMAFIFNVNLYKMEHSSTEEEDETMEMFLKQLARNIVPDDRKAFMDLCITKKEKCDESNFMGKTAIFQWKPSATEKDRERFWRSYLCVYLHQPNECPVDGAWSEWSLWSNCDAACEETGNQMRTRMCENPRPSGGGDECDGLTQRNQSCVGLCVQGSNGREEANEYLKQIHEMYHELVKLCMERHCLYSQVRAHIKDGRRADKYWSSLMCIKFGGACPVNGGWGEWGLWSDCSVKCGYGEKFRKRECDKPVTQHGGIICQGDWHLTERCLAKNCDKGLTFSGWSSFSPCSERCGKYGTKTSARSCLSETPCMLDGRGISEIVKTVPCFGGFCPVDGGWSKWGMWTECSSKCGAGRRTRLRWCDNPYPYGGRPCPGPTIDLSSCAGGYCIQPAPAPANDDDDDDDERRRRRRSILIWEPIRTQLPFLNRLEDYVSDWWDDLHGKVKVPKEEFNKTHRGSQSSNGLAKSPLYHLDLEQLEVNLLLHSSEGCSSPTAACSYKERGQDGNTTKHRLAYQESTPSPHSGNRSKRAATEAEVSDPYSMALNVDLEALYTPWTQWSQCTTSCGVGTRRRTRHCRDRLTVCRGEVQPVEFCNIKPCPVAGGWSAWGMWTPCSVTCGKGVSQRYRKCDNPLPTYGGSCLGQRAKSQACILPRCPATQAKTWSAWGEWSACSASCGFGAKSRSRFRKLMSDVQTEESVCNGFPCPENGLWAAWGAWSSCTRPCGLGRVYRDRTCTDPSPLYRGQPCDGQGSDIQSCFGGPCIDDDDTGVLLRGNSYLKYNAKGKSTEMLMIFMRFRSLRPTGTMFHHTRQCEKKKPCKIEIKLKLSSNTLCLFAQVEGREKIEIKASSPIQLNDWNDVLVIVTTKWVELKLNDHVSRVEWLTGDLDEPVNVDGELVVGANVHGESGFHGEVAVLRKNFKAFALLPMKAWSGQGVPVTTKNIGKVTLPTDVRHPNFHGVYFSHLFFRKSKILHVSAVLQVTGSNGLLFFNGGEKSSSFVSVAVERNGIKFCLSCGEKAQCRKAYEIETGKWFLLNFIVDGREAVIRMNNGDAMQIMCSGDVRYLPRSSLYVAGAKGTDWDTIVDISKNDVRFNGLIDTVDLNGDATSFKMATLLDSNGMVNALGYSLADHVTEIYGHHKSLTTLRCAFSTSEESSHFIKLVWLKNMVLLQSDKHTEIVNTESSGKVVSVVNVFPGHKADGLYACLENTDGELSVVHVFLVMLYNDNVEDDTEGESEWIIFVVLVVLLVLILAGIFAYCYLYGRSETPIIEDTQPVESDNEGDTTEAEDTTTDTDAGNITTTSAESETDSAEVPETVNLVADEKRHRVCGFESLDQLKKARKESFHKSVRQSLEDLRQSLQERKESKTSELFPRNSLRPLAYYRQFSPNPPCSDQEAGSNSNMSPVYCSQTNIHVHPQQFNCPQMFPHNQPPYQFVTPVNTGEKRPTDKGCILGAWPAQIPHINAGDKKWSHAPAPMVPLQHQRHYQPLPSSTQQIPIIDMMKFSPTFDHDHKRTLVNDPWHMPAAHQQQHSVMHSSPLISYIRPVNTNTFRPMTPMQGSSCPINNVPFRVTGRQTPIQPVNSNPYTAANLQAKPTLRLSKVPVCKKTKACGTDDVNKGLCSSITGEQGSSAVSKHRVSFSEHDSQDSGPREIKWNVTGSRMKSNQ